MSLAWLGFGMIAVFMTLILTKRLSAVAALILIPILFGVIAGFGPGLGGMMIEGVKTLAPTALMLVFAVLFFAVMIDTGLFDPLVRRILKFAADDPVRVTVGTALLATVVSIDGDGATSALVTISAMLPVYRRLGLNPLILATLLGLCNCVLNMLPWGGPTARAAIALRIDMTDVVGPMLPVIGLSLIAIHAIAWRMGVTERRRLVVRGESLADNLAILEGQAELIPNRTRNLWFNLALTVGLIVGLVSQVAPLPLLMMGAFAVAVTVNFPRLSEQRAALAAHGDTVLSMVSLMFAAGAFTGILNGTGMVKAMAGALVAAIPPELGVYMGPLTGLASLPLMFFMSNDAFFYGVLPVLGAAGETFGVSREVIARAALAGAPVHGLSPLVAPLYLIASLVKAEVGELQKFGLPWALGMSLFVLAASILVGAVPWP